MISRMFNFKTNRALSIGPQLVGYFFFIMGVGIGLRTMIVEPEYFNYSTALGILSFLLFCTGLILWAQKKVTPVTIFHDGLAFTWGASSAEVLWKDLASIQAQVFVSGAASRNYFIYFRDNRDPVFAPLFFEQAAEIRKHIENAKSAA